MTCIAGLETEDGDVLIGADSWWGNSGYYQRIDGGKVFRIKNNVGDILMGLTGTPRVAQLICNAMEVPRHRPHMSDTHYLVVEFTTALREMLDEHGALNTESTDAPAGHSRLLMGYQGKLYFLTSHLQITRASEGYQTGGSAYQYALGVLALDIDMDPVMKISKSILAATRHSPSACPPISVHSLDYPDFKHRVGE